MQLNLLTTIISTAIFMSLIYFLIIALVILCMPNIRMNTGFFNVRARIDAKKRYLSEPTKDSSVAKRYLTGFFISGFLAALCTGGQIFVMANGYPVEATIISCTAYGFTWWYSRTSKLTRNYWEQARSEHAEFRLSSANIFWLKQILFKTILVVSMLESILLMIYMLYLGHNQY